jgi:hypothetical protein
MNGALVAEQVVHRVAVGVDSRPLQQGVQILSPT